MVEHLLQTAASRPSPSTSGYDRIGAGGFGWPRHLLVQYRPPARTAASPTGHAAARFTDYNRRLPPPSGGRPAEADHRVTARISYQGCPRSGAVLVNVFPLTFVRLGPSVAAALPVACPRVFLEPLGGKGGVSWSSKSARSRIFPRYPRFRPR